MSEKIRVIQCIPNKTAKVGEIENELKAFQDFVGGSIEVTAFYTVPDVGIVCNEEGKIRGLQPCLLNGWSDVIFGNCFICGLTEDDFTDLTDEQIEQIKTHLLVE